MPPTGSRSPHVHVVGGGISGLTAALRLAERGYKVTVYEEKKEVGGNLAAPGGFDVYPHMFGTHYQNFWTLAERDLGLRRQGEGRDFEPRDTFKVLDKGKFPRYLDMLNVGSPESVWASLIAGVAPPEELFLAAYSMIDKLSYSDADDDVLDEVSVEGFLRTRPYGTDTLSELYKMLIMTIWSVQSHETSMAAYRRFVERWVAQPVPLLWLLTGNLHDKLIGPLQEKITGLGGEFKTSARVLNVRVERAARKGPRRVTRLDWTQTRRNEKLQKWVNVGGYAPRLITPVPIGPNDAVILAVPPTALANILSPRHGYGERGHRVVDILPLLTEVNRLRGEPIPVLYLGLTRRLEDIPKEHVLLRESAYDVTFIDLSQIWHDDRRIRYNGKDRTLLCFAASDYWAFPISDDPQSTTKDVIELMRAEVEKYVPTIRDAETDWGQTTRFTPNTDRMLFLNRAGGMQWQPERHYPDDIANLFFAGDVTINPIRMATVEAAVVSGLRAAQAICERRPHSKPVDIQIPDSLPQSSLLALKTMLAPWAYAAKCWSSASDVIRDIVNGDAEQAKASLADALRDAYATPGEMAVDVWKSLILAAAQSGARALQPTLQQGLGRDRAPGSRNKRRQ
jgi:phytoene dehydrogenase-like protein